MWRWIRVELTGEDYHRVPSRCASQAAGSVVRNVEAMVGSGADASRLPHTPPIWTSFELR